jgi:beta-glucanase (GH16 family)
MKKLFVSLSMLIVSVVSVYALPPTAAGYGLAWSDEFNGTSLDTINNWNYDTVYRYNGTQERYTLRCVTVENGSLVIWSRYDSSTHWYPSGWIDSHDKKIFTYGYFEASIKAPLGQVSGPGLWSSVWLLGNSIYHGVAWPTCGELELYEQRPSNLMMQANSPQPVPPTIGDNEFIECCHYGVNGSPSYHCCQHNYPTALSDHFHTYGILWDSLHIEYYFDDTLFWGVDFPVVNGTNFGVPSITLPDNFTAFHSPFYWIINVAVGGSYQGQNINRAIFPTKMELDYVRVYQKSTQTIANSLNHTLKVIALANPSRAQLKVYDVQGRLVADYTDRVRSLKLGQNVMNGLASNLPIGIYAVRFFDGGKPVSEKLVIQKKDI